MRSPSQLLGDAWFDYDDAYPVSGSFVCFLLDNYGVERFKKLYPRHEFLVAFQEIYKGNGRDEKTAATLPDCLSL